MKIIAPRRNEELIGRDGAPTNRVSGFLEDLERINNERDDKINSFTGTNVTEKRDFDADTVTLQELADVVGTLIADLK